MTNWDGISVCSNQIPQTTLSSQSDNLTHCNNHHCQWFPNLPYTVLQNVGLWVCHKRKALFSIIEVDIYLFANNERTVESGRKALQIVFLAINRDATQNIQTVQTTVKKLPWNSCFEVNCRTLHAPRQEEWDPAIANKMGAIWDTSYIGL